VSPIYPPKLGLRVEEKPSCISPKRGKGPDISNRGRDHARELEKLRYGRERKLKKKQRGRQREKAQNNGLQEEHLSLEKTLDEREGGQKGRANIVRWSMAPCSKSKSRAYLGGGKVKD